MAAQFTSFDANKSLFAGRPNRLVCFVAAPICCNLQPKASCIAANDQFQLSGDSTIVFSFHAKKRYAVRVTREESTRGRVFLLSRRQKYFYIVEPLTLTHNQWR